MVSSGKGRSTDAVNLISATLLTLALIAGLFALATFVEKRGKQLEAHSKLRHRTYTLALGVYCTSWTFYGAVGSAVRDGWNYLPIYLAPILLLVAAPRFLRRLAEAVAQEQATAVSDFIAARFGHDVPLARLVTATALLGSIPYVALQLRSIGSAMTIVSGHSVAVPAMVTAAILLAFFAMLFGARRFELAGRSEGLVYAIGVDSLIKIVALATVAGLAVVMLFGEEPERIARGTAMLAESFRPGHLSLETMTIFLISTTAIIALPRQFYMGLVEAREPDDLVRARFGLATYFALMAVLVLPIALTGMSVLGARVVPDLYMLELPASQNSGLVIAAALLGGVSAAASMAIVDTTALATMVSNDFVFPSVLRRESDQHSGAIGRRMLGIRRASMLAIMMLALSWALLVSPGNSLASIGLISFAAMAQFTPHLLLATQRGGRDPLAARASLATGLALWLYTLALPPILPRGWLAVLAQGPLDPFNLFGIGAAPPLVHGVFWSLGANLAVLLLLSARRIGPPALPRILRGQREVSDLNDLVQLTASFVGAERAEAEFPQTRTGGPIDRKAAQRAQELISRVVGVSSARTLVASALAGGKMSLPEVTRLLDEGGQSLRFSRQLLAATFENIEAGISVVDAELNLVAWNTRYLDIFEYPPGLVRVGVPVADLIRHNALRGDFGPGDTEFHVAKRLEHLLAGHEHSFERQRSDGRVIKTVGGPMPGGGYVMSFTDITGEARMREELEQTLGELEARVGERTRELSEANRRLAEVNREKTRFLAAASHDLLQPLHAARLFTAALASDPGSPDRAIVERVDGAIVAAEDLLRALLDISKIDAGGITPACEPLALADFLGDLVESFRPLATQQGLDLRRGPMPGIVESDPGLLRSVMQNFLTNAVRYTERGAILVGVRRRGEMLRIDVIDTGVGMGPEQLETIFDEFTRLGQVDVEGFGLGLALVERISRLLGGRVEVASHPGKGSRFSLLLPASDDDAASLPVKRRRVRNSGRRLRVLVVDNDQRIVEATTALLERLGHYPLGASDTAGALALCDGVDALLADYRLDRGEDGLRLIEAVRARRPALPALLITAESEAEMRERAASMGVEVLAKPVDPQAIERFLAEASVAEIEPE
jgi:signal transduction histidine kinase/CheY-like chemotaxis protein